MLKRFRTINLSPPVLMVIIFLAGILAVVALLYHQSTRGVVQVPNHPAQTAETPAPVEPREPELSVSEVLGGLSNPWEIAFLPDESFLVNERRGRVTHRATDGTRTVTDIRDVYAAGEGGLTGLAVDVDFAANRYVYTCFNAQMASGLDVRVARWRLGENMTLQDRQDIVTGIPSNRSGRHSGCRIKMDKSGSLWVGTGDAAVASYPQNPQSLGGKILRVTRDGMPAGGNLPAPFDPRIFSYGHRNVQGLVLFDEPRGDVFGYSVEHGSSVDDEINLIRSGNFGWAPRVTYVERGVPMTDLGRFPDAVSAIWSSGGSTIAPSGIDSLTGDQWGTWQGALALSVLKDKHVRIMKFDSEQKLVLEKQVLADFGRVRSTVLGADGNLYITTDNGSNDKIMKVTPVGGEGA